MRHIYSRAQTVLVWLGTADFKKEIWEITFNRVGLQDDYDMDSSEALISDMCNRDYWNKVWIVQEIGRARKIRIHYGTGMIAWDTFIDSVKTKRNVADYVPLKLAKQLSQKFTDGHKLENLLRLHENALCKEPRDKVYGFAGLAIDCQDRLPIDYEKSLFEVWKDAIIFKNSDRNAYQSGILQFGRLVKSMLGGPGIANEEELKREEVISSHYPLYHEEPGMLRVPVLLRGMIVHLSPTYDEFFSNLKKADEWEVALNNKISGHLLPSARAENDSFLELLHELDDVDLKRIYDIDRDILFDYGNNPFELEGGYFSYLAAGLGHQPIRDQTEPWESPTAIVEDRSMPLPIVSSTLQSRLFLLATLEMQSAFPASCMGLVSTAAREGDFICHLYKTDQAIIVRKDKLNIYRLVGTAVAAKGHATGQKISKDGLGESPRFAVPYVSETGGSEIVPLYIDLALAYELSV